MAVRRALDDPFASGGQMDPSLESGSPFEVSSPGMPTGDGDAPPPVQDFSAFDGGVAQDPALQMPAPDPFADILPAAGTPTIPPTAQEMQPADLLTSPSSPVRVQNTDATNTNPGSLTEAQARDWLTSINGQAIPEQFFTAMKAKYGYQPGGMIDPSMLDTLRQDLVGGAWPGGIGPKTPAGPTTGTTGTTSGPTSGTVDLTSLLAQIHSLTGGVTPALPGGFGPEGGPVLPDINQVGQDPLSQLIDSALAGVMKTGGTPYTQQVQDALAKLVGEGGLPQPTQGRLNAARDDEATAFQGQLADARNALAAAGTLSEPGTPQGPTSDAISRISYNLAPKYASAVSEIESHAMDMANSNVMSALSLATGLSENEAANVLSAAGEGTQRQQTLANIALGTLDRNIQWNEFLANYGLNRDQIAEQLQQGRTGQVIQLLQLFLNSAQIATGGYI